MRKKIEVKILCDKCGKEQEPDKESSNKNWSVYQTNVKCKCGGKFSPKVIEINK